MTGIRVFLADDHELVRMALRSLIDDEPDMEVVGEASDTEGAVAGALEHRPDVLLLDLRMPGAGGVEACRAVRKKADEVAVLILSSFDQDDDVYDAVEAGAAGYLLKETRPRTLVDAIRQVADGNAVFESSVARRVVSSSGRNGHDGANGDETSPPDNPLSGREMEVLDRMAKGMSNREIAQALWISETTVKTHVSHILGKLGERDRTQAVLAAARMGLVSID